MDKMVLSRLASKVINTPLMILPNKLDVILSVIGERIGIDQLIEVHETTDIMAQSNRSTVSKNPKIAVVPVYGSLVNRTHGLDAMSGLTTYDSIRNDFNAAMDSDADAVMLDIDSPGGEASGVMDLSDEIYQARGTKPIYAIANESAFSAAYAIASAADKIFLSRTGHVGSIGVIAVHQDKSAANEKAGVKYTTVFKGDRKADLSPNAPLSDEAKQMLEDEVADHYDLFVKTVARNRGIPEAQVKQTQAAIFMGEKAVANKLADEVLAFSDVQARILADLNVNLKAEEGIDMSANKDEEKITEKEVKIMNAQELKEKYPELVAEIESGVSAKFEQKLSAMADDKRTLTEAVLKLEKLEAIRQVKEVQAEANNIWASALNSSDIPDRLHEKVKVQVSHEKFLNDGVLDRAGFTEAVKAEVSDWETRGATSTVMGVGFSSKDVEDDGTKRMKLEEQADEDLADAMFAASSIARKGVK